MHLLLLFKDLFVSLSRLGILLFSEPMSFEVNKEEIHNKGLNTILGVDVLIGKKSSTVKINEAKHTVKVTDLTRAGKLIHKKVTLISHE